MSKIVLVALIAVLGMSNLSAQPLEYQKEYYVIADFIEADLQCKQGNAASCGDVQRLCGVVKPNTRRFVQFIQNEHPIRGRNGGMNIKARYDRALRTCQ